METVSTLTMQSWSNSYFQVKVDYFKITLKKQFAQK